MSEVQTETTQYEVKLPKPRTPKVLVGAVVAVLFVAVVALAATALMKGAAQSQAEATAQVMPANTMLYFSLNTHTDKLPNFNVIADAWKDSKEARQVAAALELALSQADVSWEDDIAPWLGDRAAFGLIDLGGKDEADPSAFSYRAPAFVVAVQTRDRATSDKFLTSLRAKLEKTTKPTGYYTTTVSDDTYRGIPLVYMTSEMSMGWSDNSPTKVQENLAYATVKDVIVLTQNRTQLQHAIDAALDSKSLSTSANYQTVMNALPDQNAGTFYMDYAQYMDVAFKQLQTQSQETSDVFDNIYTNVYSNPQSTPSPDFLKMQEENKRRREEQRSQQEAQLAQIREMSQAMGGIGMVMTYEPTGIRFDMVAQQDSSKLPEKWRALQSAMRTPASNQVFNTIPSDAVLAANMEMSSETWSLFLDPDYLAMMFASVPGASKEEITTQLDQFQKLVGLDLKSDLLGLFNGEAALVILPKAEQTKSELGFSLPFQFAAMLDSSDAAKATSSLDKLAQGVSALAGKDSVKWQSLSGLPYSVVLDPNGSPMLTYGVVDGRVVIGTDSNTLIAIDNADQAPLSSNETFKQATGLLSSNRLATFYVNFQPLWKWLDAQAAGSSSSAASGINAVLNYLRPFKWMASDDEAPANNLQRSSVHIGIGQ